jgi:putative Holliday junction resolvase
MGGVLAIDYGDRKCGFASTDALRIALEPLGVLRHDGRDEVLFEHLEGLLAERDVEAFVVGLPVHMSGAPGQRAEIVRAFLARLRARFPRVAVYEWDERLTTKEAEARLRERGLRGRAAKAQRDAWSALVLLEDWLSVH